jgi:hypothetical protein
MTTYARHRINANHIRVLELLAELRDASDSQIVRRWAAYATRRKEPWAVVSDSTIRSCRADLVRWGLIERAPGLGKTRYAQPTRLWALAASSALPLPVSLAPDGSAALTAALLQAQQSGDLAKYARLIEYRTRADKHRLARAAARLATKPAE